MSAGERHQNATIVLMAIFPRKRQHAGNAYHQRKSIDEYQN
jgi:hypothetical protein